MSAPGRDGRLAQRLRHDPRRVVVIDDDPTGTQTVSDVDVILTPDPRAYEAFFAGPSRATYVLSNTRALDRNAATRCVKDITEGVRAAAAAADETVAIVLRGDSTLRGHVFAEMDVVGSVDAVGFLVPAFPEGGRTTADGIHWLETASGARIPVSDTEFARDPAFGFKSRTLDGWVAEVGHGRATIVVPLSDIRSTGPRAVREALLAAPARSVVIPEADSRKDLETAVIGLLDAESAGREIVVRSASTFAALRAGLDARSIRAVKIPEPGRVLIVCGSHTAASTEQLQRLAQTTGVDPTELPLGSSTFRPREFASVIGGVTHRLASDLGRHGFAILSTPRTQADDHDSMASGARIMDMVVEATGSVVPSCDGLIAKGGITSAEVVRRALGSSVAHVTGQLAPGVALWDVETRAGRRMPCAIVPGNVGGPETLLDVARMFGVGR